jgi:ATP synthase I chain
LDASVLQVGSWKSLEGFALQVRAETMTGATPEQKTVPSVGERTVRRITYLIPAFGVSAGLLAAVLHHWDWAEGLVVGSSLAWLNFRWLKRGLEAFTSRAGAQTGVEKARAPVAAYLAAAFRYVLIGLALYVIFTYLHVPLVSLAVGLCVFAAATIVASVWEILQSVE